MGQEIRDSHFRPIDFVEFRRRLEEETRLLEIMLADGGLAVDSPLAGCELEAWLVDAEGRPAPHNASFLERLNDPMVVPELASYNVEFNADPQPLGAGMFDAMGTELDARWSRAQQVAAGQDLGLLMIGILPTVTQDELNLGHMSALQRYTALNEQVIRLREGAPIRIDIDGAEPLQREHGDVMLESAATSFQLHYMVDAAQAARAFNLSKMLAAPMVAMAGNSPYLFGHELWEETRIPLFEQAVSVGASDYSKRVTFGIRYAEQSIFECFQANCERYPVLLPMLMDEPPERLAHLRLHNGTIWRWVRPLIGFGADGAPHVRIEQRVLPAGPSTQDNMANAAFYFGALSELLVADLSAMPDISFEQANRNFYAAARDGLRARVDWGGEQGPIATLCLQRLLPLAARGLERIGLGDEEIGHWLGIVRARVSAQATGAAWQKAWIAQHGRDFTGLVQAYAEQQHTGLPVHQWEL